MFGALETAIITFLSLVRGLLPTLGVASTSLIATVVGSITSLVPVVAQNLPNLVQDFRDIITEIQSNGTPLTADQIVALQNSSDAVDADFEAAALAAGAPADPAAP